MRQNLAFNTAGVNSSPAHKQTSDPVVWLPPPLGASFPVPLLLHICHFSLHSHFNSFIKGPKLALGVGWKDQWVPAPPCPESRASALLSRWMCHSSRGRGQRGHLSSLLSFLKASRTSLMVFFSHGSCFHPHSNTDKLVQALPEAWHSSVLWVTRDTQLFPFS